MTSVGIKMILATIALFIVLTLSLAIVFKACSNAIEKKGLKLIVEEVWEGENN